MPAMAEYTTLWKGGLGAETPDRLRRLGWWAELHDLAAVAAAHDRRVRDARGDQPSERPDSIVISMQWVAISPLGSRSSQRRARPLSGA